ncbi:MAG: CAP domain-containing protein [Minisyncoccia bacterium]|jgi:hypothetical protein
MKFFKNILRRQWLIVFFVVILATEGFLVSNLIARQTSQSFLAAVVPAEIIALTNSERVQNDVGILSEDALLDKAAQAKADDMAKNDYFSHVGPDGKTPWQWITEAGYQYQYAGENLAVRFVDSSDVVNAWMASPTHRANIVKPVYTSIGVGVAQGMYEGQSATYVVQYFAAPLNSGANITSPLAASETSASSLASRTLTASSAVPVSVPTSTPGAVSTTSPVSASFAGAQVEGASVQVAPVSAAINDVNSDVQSFVRQALRAFAEPVQTSNWILGLCATILVLAITLTFFTHLYIQPVHPLVSGAFVALLALSLLGINSLLTGGGGGNGPNASQAASLLEAVASSGVVINSAAVETGYALFPQW